MRRLDPRKLETFRVVAQARKISTAAKLLHLSQPAVTAQIRALEEECGRALLVRSSKGVTPNDWGLRLLDTAKQVHALLGEVEGAFQDEPGVGEEVVLGASMTTASYVAPPLVAGYRAVHGRVPFRLQVANTARVLEWVADGKVPLGIVEGRLRSPRVHLERYLEDELVAVAAASARDLLRISRAADLASAPLLLREPGSNTRAVVEEALAGVLGARSVRRSELLFGSNQSIKMAAVAGLGVAFVSRWSVQLEVAAGTLRILPLRDLRLTRSFSWATASPRLQGAAGRFQAWSRQHPPPRP
ncbi:LysR substrate-binding domain-containing protein [Anaeromyxobacter dehalogenans]|uniref:Transcriptional regulator, LysR family n=1 Tax=Anaeromyxobacter dehalogenans (strain 2CP-C) TaxID=290397 RepID=Q2IJY9_ANADE|nr:LysR substrate-binding domain-containing protein [Anaeromyxobacter dehalogenans]ABC81967.1 transcriptional regulator, LysR family [Anaeromyxobacter dehalogenans 2CP-C]